MCLCVCVMKKWPLESEKVSIGVRKRGGGSSCCFFFFFFVPSKVACGCALCELIASSSFEISPLRLT